MLPKTTVHQRANGAPTAGVAEVDRLTAHALRRVLSTPGFQVREYEFEAGHANPPHVHDGPALVVILRGGYEQRYRGRSLDCPETSVKTVPAGERHSETVGPTGVHGLIVAPTPVRERDLDGVTDALDRFARYQGGGVRPLADRLYRECRRPDDALPLAAEAALLDLLVTVARSPNPDRAWSGLPGSDRRRAARWLERAKELVDDRFAEPITLSVVSEAVQVSRATLARRFRQTYGVSIGEYVRERRLQEAERLIARTREPLSHVALQTGFYDQSHLGNAFRRRFGLTPMAYRGLGGGTGT